METLKQQILAKDPGASVRAHQLGRAANPMLLDFAKNPDEDIRRVALYCLRETGGPEAVKALIEALADEDPQVAGVAAAGLNKLFDPALAPQLLPALDRAEEGAVRYAVALLLGRMEKTVDQKEFAKRRAAEQDEKALEGYLVAFARLGDKPSQDDFVRRLQSARERDLRRFLMEHCLYINQAWLLKPLLPLLDRKENLVHYGVDARPEKDIDLRTCDVTVNVVTKISQRKFSFKIENKPYTDAAIDEVRRLLKTLP